MIAMFRANWIRARSDTSPLEDQAVGIEDRSKAGTQPRLCHVSSKEPTAST